MNRVKALHLSKCALRVFVRFFELFSDARGHAFRASRRLAWPTHVDHANTLKASGSGVYGLKTGKRMNKNQSWFGDAVNLTDKIHAATTGVIADARGADSGQFYTGEGRSMYARVQLKC